MVLVKLFFVHDLNFKILAESAKANGREPKSCLGQVLKFKLGCFIMYAMEQRTLKNVNNFLNTNLNSYL
jgi:hypothetical protein